MIRSLQQRLLLFLLLPVTLLLFSIGFFGFFFARNIMLDEWREAAILRLERAAHHIDMRLSKPVEWIKLFHNTGGMRDGSAVQEWIIQLLRNSEGVSEVKLKWTDEAPEQMEYRGRHGQTTGSSRRSMMRFKRGFISEVTPPQHDAQIGQDTVNLISNFKNENDRVIGRLEVAIRFDYLLEDIQALGWWQSDLTGLIDNAGRYLTHTDTEMSVHKRLGETDDPLELAVLADIQEKQFGTLLGPGHPPKWVSGFYKLNQAPWTIVLFAPGEKILAPIIKFRFYYAVAGSLCLVSILLLIRLVGGKMVSSIGNISRAAEQVARGKYGAPLPVKTGDEIGQLIKSFNTMVRGLKERDFIRNTFGRYVDPEIARELMRRPEATRLGGEKREVAILMSDLRGFTPLAETLSPDVTIDMLNRYFSLMIETIRKHQGIIVDFFGDALLVFFDPIEGPVAPTINQALHCALEMQSVMGAFNDENREEGLPSLKMGIGLNAGEVVVGNIGSETRAKYGIVGSAVNVTQRIQSNAQGEEIVVSESVYRSALDNLVIKKTFKTQLKGVKGSATLYVVEDFRDQS